MKTLLVAPTRREAAVIGGDVLVSGSAALARRGVTAALDERRPDAVLIAGVCGGLDPSLAPGALILARRVVSEGQPELAPDGALFEAARRALRASGLQFASSTLLTADRPLGTRREKTDAWNAHGAAGVDMETYGVVAAVQARAIPWIALRAVLDPAREALPRELLDWRGEDDERAIVRRIGRRPVAWPAYARLALQMRRALHALVRGVPAAADAIANVALITADPERQTGRHFVTVR